MIKKLCKQSHSTETLGTPVTATILKTLGTDLLSVSKSATQWILVTQEPTPLAIRKQKKMRLYTQHTYSINMVGELTRCANIGTTLAKIAHRKCVHTTTGTGL